MFERFRFHGGEDPPGSRKRKTPPRSSDVVKRPLKSRNSTKDLEIDLSGYSETSRRRPIANTRQLELQLITEFRKSHPATVDEFHLFLLSLDQTQQGPYWALVACLLCVQCRDSVALSTVRELMELAPAGIEDVQAMCFTVLQDKVRRCNFFKTKAKNIRGCTMKLINAHRSTVPRTYAALVSLPGVGPKLAHLMRSVTFGIDGTGIVVDTHVHRVARRLNWVSGARTPEHTRKQLERWVPCGSWTDFTLAVVGFGQFIQRHPKRWGEYFLAAIVIKYGLASAQTTAAEHMVENMNKNEAF